MGIEIGITGLDLDSRIEFFRTMASWLTTGGGALPVNEAIKNTCDAFSRDEYATLRGRMERIAREYESGQTLFYESLRTAALGFTEQELAIVKAAEISNQLRVAVPALVEALLMKQSSGKMLRGKMMMPIVGGFMLILMTLGVLIFMLPTVMGPVLQRSPEVIDEFPLIIQGYWAASVWLRSNYFITATFASSPIWLFLFRNTSFLKPRIERFLMWLGPSRRIILAYNAVLIVYFMPALVRASMPLPDVLRTLATTVSNSMMSLSLKKAALAHEQGYRLGDALASIPIRGAFRSGVEAGEKTGKIAERVEDLKDPFKNDFDRIVKKAVASLTLIVMAILMPFFIISMYTSLVTPMIALMEYS